MTGKSPNRWITQREGIRWKWHDKEVRKLRAQLYTRKLGRLNTPGNTDELSLSNETGEGKLNTMHTEQVAVTIKQEIPNAETRTQWHDWGKRETEWKRETQNTVTVKPDTVTKMTPPRPSGGDDLGQVSNKLQHGLFLVKMSCDFNLIQLAGPCCF